MNGSPYKEAMMFKCHVCGGAAASEKLMNVAVQHVLTAISEKSATMLGEASA